MNTSDFRQALSHILWIGGATDSGKTRIAQIIAGKYGFQAYHYDRQDARQTETLAQSLPHYRHSWTPHWMSIGCCQNRKTC